MSRYTKGLQALDRASGFVVGGVKRMNRIDDPAEYPTIFTHAAGPLAWDVDGHCYVDLVAGKGAVILGSANRRVDDAVVEAIRDGVMLPLTGVRHAALAERVCRLIPTVERVKFFRTGSCAVSAAVRLARLWTGRRRILSSGYHGWHDWFIEDRRSHPGDGSVIDFHYDAATLASILATHDDVAAVVVTPEPALVGGAAIEQCAELAAQAGALFVLDEMKTGFRFGTAGYQGSWLTPDLTTLGKAMANGYALAALGGRRDVMEEEESTHISGTYETENVGLAAGAATLESLEERNPNDVFELVRRLAGALNAAFLRHGVAARCLRSGANAHLVFESDVTARRFYREAATRGILFYCFDDINVGFAHDDVLDGVVEVVGDVVAGLDDPEDRRPSEDALYRYLRRHRIAAPNPEQARPVVAAAEARMREAEADV